MEDNETRRLNEEVLKNLKPGDVIRFFAGYHAHWAVYAGEDEKGDTIIIHWWRENVASSHWLNWWKESDVASNPRIMISSFWKFADKMEAEKENSDSINGKNVLESAKAFKQKLEEEEKENKTYPDLFDSCEHFAKWCHYGLGVIPITTEDIFRVTNVWKFVHGIFTNNTSDGKAIIRNVGVLSQLKPGDVVRFSRGSYHHWATYIGLDKKDEKRRKNVIHWWDNDGATSPDITIVPFWELAGNCTAEKINTDEQRKIAFTESEAVKYAEDWIKERKHLDSSDLDFHCSEDFAKFFYLKLMCKTMNKEERMSLAFEIPVYPFCKHARTVLSSSSRGGQMVDLLRTVEFNKLIQLFDYVCREEARLAEVNEKYRTDLIYHFLCRPWDAFYHEEARSPGMSGVYRRDLIAHLFSRPLDAFYHEEARSPGMSGVYRRDLIDHLFSRPWDDIDREEARIPGMSGVYRRDLIAHLFSRPLDPCSIFTRKRNDDILKTLKRGDLIEFVEKSRNHWGVYTGVENGAGGFIHWTADDHAIELIRMSDDCEPCIEIRSVTTLIEAEKLEKHNSDTHENTIIDGDQVVERLKAFEAKIKAGEKNGEDYSVLFRDCEQFAKWGRYGLGLKSLQMSTEDINKIKDVRMFVQGDFSDLPWRIPPNEDIRVLRMLQLGKSEAEIGKDRRHVKGSRAIADIQALETTKLPHDATRFLDNLSEKEWRSLRAELTDPVARFIQSGLPI